MMDLIPMPGYLLDLLILSFCGFDLTTLSNQRKMFNARGLPFVVTQQSRL
jgi:hypothetical protein